MLLQYIKQKSQISVSFFLLLLFVISKFVDSMEVCKSLYISIGTVMKVPEMLGFVSDHHKTKK